MSLTIKSFGERQSYELIRDEVVIGGLAYASDQRSPMGNAAFSAGKVHIHGIDAEVKASTSRPENGRIEFNVVKAGQEIGELEFDRRGRMRLKLNRIDRGSDVNTRTRRMPERVMDELSIYIAFAANVYNAKMQGITTGRWPG